MTDDAVVEISDVERTIRPEGSIDRPEPRIGGGEEIGLLGGLRRGSVEGDRVAVQPAGHHVADEERVAIFGGPQIVVVVHSPVDGRAAAAPARNPLEDTDSEEEAPARRGGGGGGSGSDDDGDSGSDGGEKRRKRRDRDRSSHELDEDDYDLLDQAGVVGYRRPNENKRKRLQRAGERAGAAAAPEAAATGEDAEAAAAAAAAALKARIFSSLGDDSSDEEEAVPKPQRPLDDDVPLDDEDDFDEMGCARRAIRGPRALRARGSPAQPRICSACARCARLQRAGPLGAQLRGCRLRVLRTLDPERSAVVAFGRAAR